MSFTYDDTLTSNLSRVRFAIGDTVASAGPRPDKRNFSDAELTYLLATETTVNASAAAAFEILSSEWTAYSLSEREGEVSFDAKGMAAEYKTRALEWRAKPGGTAEASRAGGWVTMTRVDAWSDSDEYTTQ
jgi:hypothetical protein